MHRILVTGATSIVGRELVSQLRDAGAHVRALTRNPEEGRLPAEVEVYRGDLTDPETLEPAPEMVHWLLLNVPEPFRGMPIG